MMAMMAFKVTLLETKASLNRHIDGCNMPSGESKDSYNNGGKVKRSKTWKRKKKEKI